MSGHAQPDFRGSPLRLAFLGRPFVHGSPPRLARLLTVFHGYAAHGQLALKDVPSMDPGVIRGTKFVTLQNRLLQQTIAFLYRPPAGRRWGFRDVFVGVKCKPGLSGHEPPLMTPPSTVRSSFLT